MINLIPTEYKSSLLYAKRNTKLMRWTTGILLAIGGMGIIIGAGFIYMQKSINDYSVSVEESRESLKIQRLEETQARIEGISSSLKLAVQVLSKQILFSKLIQEIGAAMPPNTILTGLQIEKVQGSIALTAQATSIDDATRVQLNLKDPKNKIFETADIESVQCGATNTKYPCRITIKALFDKDNEFYFINNSGLSR